jgi:hypothetical protein
LSRQRRQWTISTLATQSINPVETHVNHGLGSALFDGVVGNSGSTGIIRLDGVGGLGVANFG